MNTTTIPTRTSPLAPLYAVLAEPDTSPAYTRRKLIERGVSLSYPVRSPYKIQASRAEIGLMRRHVESMERRRAELDSHIEQGREWLRNVEEREFPVMERE